MIHGLSQTAGKPTPNSHLRHSCWWKLRRDRAFPQVPQHHQRELLTTMSASVLPSRKEGPARAVHQTKHIGLDDATANLGNSAQNSIKQGVSCTNLSAAGREQERSSSLQTRPANPSAYFWPTEHWTRTNDCFDVSDLDQVMCSEMISIGRQSWSLFS